METLAIVQARLGSTRLPRKIFLPLEGKTVLERVVERVRRAKLVSEVLVATTVEPEDAEVERFCASKGIRSFRGSATDVLDRYRQAARTLNPANILRVTADCPLIDPAVLDQIIARHRSEGADYTSNVLEETFPDGLDAEVFTLGTLERVWREAALPSDREHVTTFIRNHPEAFRVAGVRADFDLSGHRWTLDQAEDYEFLKAVYRELYPADPCFGMRDVVSFLARRPDIAALNAGFTRNEGYQKSLREDPRAKEDSP